jgi:hypothetical protein
MQVKKSKRYQHLVRHKPATTQHLVFFAHFCRIFRQSTPKKARKDGIFPPPDASVGRKTAGEPV